MVIFKRGLTLSLPGTSSSQLTSKTSRWKSGRKKIKLCSWGKSLRVQDSATLPFWIITLTFRLKLTRWITTSEWSPYKTRSWLKNWINSCKPTRLSDRDLTAKPESRKSELVTTSKFLSHTALSVNTDRLKEILEIDPRLTTNPDLLWGSELKI